MSKIICSNLILTALLFFVMPAHGEEVSDEDRFQLWNNCKPVSLKVSFYSSSAPGARGLFNLHTGLEWDTDKVSVTMQNKLRAARLYADAQKHPYLHVDVGVGAINNPSEPVSYYISLSYFKRTEDIASGLTYETATWQKNIRRTTKNSSLAIPLSLHELTDEFINEYLRVNAEACA